MDGPLLFLVPYYGDQDLSRQYLEETVAGFYAQSDPNWHALIVDDATPDPVNAMHLQKLVESHQGQLTSIRLSENQGLGAARNVGYEWARDQGYQVVLLNDADDISHKRRVETMRQIFRRDDSVGMVYSRFITINEYGERVETGLIPTNKDSLAMFESNPVRGFDAWIRIATEAGSVGLPSTTAVRTAAAIECPSPVETPSEATAQWMHISAVGYRIEYAPDVPTFYRVTSSVQGSTHHRRRLGEQLFYERMIRVRTQGFRTAVDAALRCGGVEHKAVAGLWLRYRLRLADNLYKVDQADLADGVLAEALRDDYSHIWLRATQGNSRDCSGLEKS